MIRLALILRDSITVQYFNHADLFISRIDKYMRFLLYLQSRTKIQHKYLSEEHLTEHHTARLNI